MHFILFLLCFYFSSSGARDLKRDATWATLEITLRGATSGVLVQRSAASGVYLSRAATLGTPRFTSNTRMKDPDGHTPRILVIEDDHVMRDMVVDYLADHDMRGLSASGSQEAARIFAQGEPDLVVLDLRLDREDGLDLLREIRTRSDVPVVITSGDRRDEIDRVVGLELGADDYLTKPFSLRELLARIRAVFRRQEAGRAVSQRDPERGRYRFGDWQLNQRSRRLTDPGGDQVALTKGEYALLTAFLDAPQRPLSREHLLQATRVHEDIFDRSIDVQILACGASWRPIRARRGSFRPSAASATSLPCRSKGSEA